MPRLTLPLRAKKAMLGLLAVTGDSDGNDKQVGRGEVMYVYYLPDLTVFKLSLLHLR